MLTLVSMVVVFAILCLVFLILGSWFFFIGKEKEKHILSFFTVGFLAYFFLFEFVGFFYMIRAKSLHSLSTVWVVIISVLCVASIGLFRKKWLAFIKESIHSVPWKNPWFYLMILLIGIQCVIVLISPDNSLDSAYYVANVTTNLTTDTINCFEPFSGAARSTIYVRYLFGLYPTANAVTCQLSGLHPLVVTKMIMFVMTVLLSYSVYIQIGRKLFKNHADRAYMMVCFICVLNLFFHTNHSTASFLLTRGYEGKAILGNVVLPFVFYMGLCLYEEHKNIHLWLILGIIPVAAVDISMSAMLIVPVAISAMLLPQILMKKQWKFFQRYVLVMIPAGIILVVYMLAKTGYLHFYIR